MSENNPIMDDKKLFLTDEEGNNYEMEILFTFDSEDGSKHYVLFFDPTDEDGEVFASYYNEEGQLDPISDESEWSIIEEMFETFLTEIDDSEDDSQPPIDFGNLQ